MILSTFIIQIVAFSMDIVSSNVITRLLPKIAFLTRYNIPGSFSSHMSASSMTTTLLSMTSPMPTNTWGEITNYKTSKTVKLFKSVHRASKSKRHELGLTVAEGVRLVSDILSNDKSRQLVRRIVVSDSLLHDGNGADSESITDPYQKKLRYWLQIVDEESRQRTDQSTVCNTNNGFHSVVHACSINVGTDEVVAACSGTVTSQGIVALVDIPPSYTQNLAPVTTQNIAEEGQKVPPPFYLILDGLSDPGNVGSLLRTCAASYVSALILLPGSCDVWNPKVVRSAMGASFRVPILESRSFEEVLDHLENHSVKRNRIFAATMDVSGSSDSHAHYDVDFTIEGGGSAIVLGAEGEGLRSDVRNLIKHGEISTIHVPMAPGMESLNAAICGSVIMFERMRQLSSTNER